MFTCMPSHCHDTVLTYHVDHPDGVSFSHGLHTINALPMSTQLSQ